MQPQPVKHVGQRMKKQNGFEVGYSKALKLGNNASLHMTREQYNTFQNGGNIQLPTKMLQDLMEKNLIGQERISFRLHSTSTGIMVLCGVRDFHQLNDELIFIPDWMHEYIDVKPGDNIFFSQIQVPQCQFVKLKPESCEFYQLNDHAKLLQHALENFMGIYEGQWICLQLDMKKFWFTVVECRPTFASLIGATVKVDFETADGYDAYERRQKLECEFKKLEDPRFFQIKRANAPDHKANQVVSLTFKQGALGVAGSPEGAAKAAYNGKSHKL